VPAAVLVLFGAAGVRTPLLAALALRRVRNLAVVVLPYGVGLLLVPLLAQGVRAPDRVGLVAVALAPALLAGPTLAARIGTRMDRAGALLVGTIVAAFVLGLREGGAPASTAQAAAIAFVVGAGITSAVPMLPAAVRTAIQWLGELAFVAILAIAVARVDEIATPTVIATVAVVVATALIAATVARIGGVDPTSALLGAGTRDPAVAAAVTLAAGGATVVPVLAALLLTVLLAALAVVNRRKSR
jgi:hypothetical protein